MLFFLFFFFQAEDGIRDKLVTGVQTCALPIFDHPHSQLIALPIVPRRVREEVDNCWHYYDEKERCIFCDIVRQERDTGERVIGENEHFITIAPYASRFPFEMWLLPKVHGSSYENNQSSIYASLARMLKDTLMRLDEVLDRSEEHTSEIQSLAYLVCRLLLEKKK